MGTTNSKVDPAYQHPNNHKKRHRNKNGIIREDSAYRIKKVSLTAVPEEDEDKVEDEMMKSRSNSNDSQNAAQLALKKFDRDLATNFRDATKSSMNLESEVSIVVSGASDYDSDFTVPNGNTSTPLLKSTTDTKETKGSDQGIIDTSVENVPQTDNTQKSETNIQGKNFEIAKNKSKSVSDKENPKSKTSSSSGSVDKATERPQKQTGGEKRKSVDKQRKGVPGKDMGSNNSTLTKKFSSDPEIRRNISKERRNSTDIVQMEYLYRTSRDKAKERQRKKSVGDLPKKVISATKYPNKILNGNVVTDVANPPQDLPNVEHDIPQMTPTKDQVNNEEAVEKSQMTNSPQKRVRISSDPAHDADDFYSKLALQMENTGFLKGIPSVSLFSESYGEYLKMGLKIPKDDNGTVIISPPTTKKSELLKSLDFTTIDIHASRIPQKMREKSLREMTKFLIKPAGSSRIERVRAIFVWLVTADLESVDVETETEQEDVESESETQNAADIFLKDIKNGEMTKTQLFATMCKLAGIECRTVEGITREYVRQPSAIVTETNPSSWSVVVIQQSWRLVDVNKASAIYKMATETTDTMGIQKENTTDSIFGNRKSPITDIIDYYFFTDPEQLVFSNLPDEENYQLLPRPVSYAEFTYLPFIKPHFFILGFEEVDQYESVTETETGQLEYWLKPPDTRSYKMACNFYKVDGKSNKHFTQQELRDYVYLEGDVKTGYFTVKVYVPIAGTYVLEINGRDGVVKSDRNSGLCSYVIKCSRSLNFQPYIENDREEWGPGSDCYIMGFKPITHLGGQVHLDNGESVIEFETSNPLYILCTLSNYDYDASDLANFVIHRIEDNRIYIHVRVPKAGDYALKIFARKEEENGIFTNVCTYLILADKVFKENLPYPKVDDGLVGVNNFFHKLNMEILQPKLCILHCPDSGKLKLKFNLAPNVHYLPEFKLCRGNEETPMHEYTMWSLVGLMGTFRLLFPQQGMYLFSLYAILPDLGDKVNSVYNAVITCDMPMKRCFPFAASLASWTPYYRLIAPKEMYLISGTIVPFLVDIPDAIKVSVIGNGGWQHLEKNDDGLWAADISIEPGQEGSIIKMFASIEEGSKSLFSLLKFKIVSKEEMTEMLNVQENYYQLAQQRLGEIKESGNWKEPVLPGSISSDEIDDGISDITVPEPVEMVPVEEPERSPQSDATKSPKKTLTSTNKKRKSGSKRKILKKSKHRERTDLSSSTAPSTEHSARGSPRKEDSELYEETSEVSDESENDNDDDDNEDGRDNEEDRDKEDDGSNSEDSVNSWEVKMAEYEEWKKSNQESEKKGNKKQLKVMKSQLIANRLRVATRRKDKLELIRAIDDWKSMGNRKTNELIRAERMLDVITLRDDLNTHLKNRNMQSLKKTLQEVEFKGYVSEIPYEVSQARSRLELSNQFSPIRRRGGTIDVQTLAEIRSYTHPAEAVHKIVVAMLLLMGVPEKNTKKWKKCQKRCVVSGKNGLHSRLHDVQPNEIHPSIAARASEIINEHSYSEAESISPGVGALYNWIHQMILAVQEENKDDKRIVKPASKKKQKLILREPTELSEDALPLGDDKLYIREKTQSHFRTQSKSRTAIRESRAVKSGSEKARGRSRSLKSRDSSPSKTK